MLGKVIQISTVLTPAGVALYALTDQGKVYEKLVGQQNAVWVQITT
jgi:hypothetical protein